MTKTMEKIPSFNACIETTIKKHWELDALTDYKGATLQYQDVARRIEKLHILFEHSGIQRGDKIALCGRNMSNWAVSFLAVITYGAVAVPVLHEFTADQVHNIVNHSEARLLFVGDVVAGQIDPEKMPALEGIINIPDFSLMVSRSVKLTEARETLNKLFGEKYPKQFTKDMVTYYKEQNPEELALINYTSGTTGFSKGVMIPYRAMWSNLDFASQVLDKELHAGDNTISILPMAHMYGMAFEFIKEFMTGCHIFYLTRIPSPAVVAQAFTDVKPIIIIAVPLVIEKIIRKKVFPKVTPAVRILMKTPIVGTKIKAKILKQVYEAFGGKLYEMIVGGAALNQEVEHFLKEIKFPITVGYGATECAPIISYADWHTHKAGSCGRAVVHMEVKIDSKKPHKEPGEILARGLNVMLGYFKNEEATAQTLDKEGWYHTGDLGIMDKKGNIFIKGRSKNMLLGPSGQNIFPEEIEDALNSLPMVMESIVVQRENHKLVALVHPDIDACTAKNMSSEDVETLMKQNMEQLNATQPAYCKISSIEICDEEFEKTPKKSIKRYLYK